MAQPIETVYRDFTTDGNPASGFHEPIKSNIRDLHNAHLVALTGATSGAIVKTSLSDLNSDLDYNADVMAWVVGDSTQGNDGVYQKQGASGAGSWTRLKDLPYSVIQLNNANAGTANAIQATTAVNTPDAAYGALLVLNITTSNTGAVTLSVNGEAAKPVVTNTNAAITSGYFVAGMAVICVDDGTSYRLLSYGDASAIQAAAEAAQLAAEIAQAAAEAAVSAVYPNSRTSLKGVDTTTITNAYLTESLREGPFGFNSNDLSNILSKEEFVSVDVNSTTNVITTADIHNIKLNDPLFTTVAVNGLSADTIYRAVAIYVSALDYDAQTAEFTAGETITGGTSGATATIQRVIDGSSNTGRLYIESVTGTFVNNETITSAAGSATTHNLIKTVQDNYRFSLATNMSNARSGTIISLTGTSAVTLKLHSDPDEGIYIIPTGKAFDGSQGAWVRRGGWAVSGADPAWLGVSGDATTDDTDGLQNYFDMCSQLGIKASLGSNRGMKISSTLKINRPLFIQGNGFEGDLGAVYLALYNASSQDWKSSVILPDGNFTAIECSATWWRWEGFQIQFTYPATPTTSAIGFDFAVPMAGYERGAFGRMRDICVNRGYFGGIVRGQFDWEISSCAFLNNDGYGLLLKQEVNPGYPNPNNGSHSDSTITACSIFNNTLAGILIQSGGGYRITNNKINYGSSTVGIGISVQPDLLETTPEAQIEPLIISDNSIEGMKYGIVFDRAAGSTTQITWGTVSGNQIWTGAESILSVDDGAGFINGFTFIGNTLQVGEVGATVMSINGAVGCTFAGNHFGSSSTGVTAYAFGASNSLNKISNSTTGPFVSLGGITAPTLAASGVNMTNTNPFPVRVSFYGGTATIVAIQNSAVFYAPSGEALQFTTTLEPNENIYCTYSVAPTMIWQRAGG